MNNDHQKLVPFDRGRRAADPVRMREFAATARRLKRERDEAAELVERLLHETPRAEWPRLGEDVALRNSGVLEHLSREVQRRLDRDPQEALAISNVATVIAETLPTGAYPPVVVAQLRAQAWKDRGQALSYVARYDESLDALDRAEWQLEPFGTVAHDQAIVRFARAMTLQDLQRFEESLALLAECQSVFRDHGDARLHLVSAIAQGMLLHRLHKYRDARETYVLALQTARECNDRRSEACLHNNLGHTLVELGDYATANIHLSKAMAMFTDLGLAIEASKTEVARGRMLARSGDIAAALPILRETRARFLMHGLVEEAGLCGLDIVDALLVRNATADAESLARQIIDDFTAAHLSTRAITALGYLQEAIAARRATAETVENVRQYVRVLHEDPQRDFCTRGM